jgi:hypothetical protein
MDKLDFDYLNTDDETASNLMASVAQKYIESLNLPLFNPEGLEFARSEKEINKCKMIRERLEERKARKNSDSIKEDISSSKTFESKHSSKRKDDLVKAKKMFKKQGASKSKSFKRRR